MNTVIPQVQEALRTVADVQAGVQTAVVDAVAEFLGDTALWSAVDQMLGDDPPR